MSAYSTCVQHSVKVGKYAYIKLSLSLCESYFNSNTTKFKFELVKFDLLCRKKWPTIKRITIIVDLTFEFKGPLCRQTDQSPSMQLTERETSATESNLSTAPWTLDQMKLCNSLSCHVVMTSGNDHSLRWTHFGTALTRLYR